MNFIHFIQSNNEFCLISVKSLQGATIDPTHNCLGIPVLPCNHLQLVTFCLIQIFPIRDAKTWAQGSHQYHVLIWQHKE